MQKERDNRTCFCRCNRKAWYAMDETSRTEKSFNAGDAYFRGHEIKISENPTFTRSKGGA